MNAFCFVGLDIGHYNIAVYASLMRRKTKLANFQLLSRRIKTTSNSLTNCFNSRQMG